MVKKAPKTQPNSLVDAVAQSLSAAPEKQATAPDEKSGIKRDSSAAEVPEPRRKLVEKWCKEVRADKHYFDKVFKRMRDDMGFARLGAEKRWVDGDNYTVPIINRFVNQATASLYAKNPKAVAKRKPKLLYTVWDGTQQTAQAALSLVTSGQDQSGQAMQIIQEVQQAKSYDQLMSKMGRTLEILYEYFMGEDFPDVKKRLKAAVRRAKTTGVAYVELSFHRAMEPDPDITERIGDMTQKLAFIKSQQANLKDGIIKEGDVEVEALEQAIKTLEEEKMMIVEEGLMFDFPDSTAIIPHRKIRQLSGFIRADYITREYMMFPEEIQEMFEVDIGSNYKDYSSGASGEESTVGNKQEGDRGDNSGDDSDLPTNSDSKQQKKGQACVWRVMNKKTREEFWLCDGYPDYLREPRAPENQVKGFWWLYSLTFNDVEDEKEVFPTSDVNYLKHPQREFNNAREGLREHRRANRPKWFTKKGAMTEEDKTNLENAPAFSVVELAGIEGDMTIDKLIQPWRGINIDPNLYETGSIMKDVLFGVGSQEADLGQTGDATATESSIAEQSRMSTLASNVDDLDEFLSEIAKGASQILLQQMSKQQVMEIVGPGAVWPELDRETILKELYLDVKAGSSGRPNQAHDLANLERAMQWLLQLGGVNGTVLAKRYSGLLDIDEEELIVEGMPSITSLNAIAAQKAATAGQIQAGAADASNQVHVAHATGQVPPPGAVAPAAPTPAAKPAQPTNPNQQANGMAGGHNMPTMPGPTGPQPAYTAPVHRHAADGGRVI